MKLNLIPVIALAGLAALPAAAGQDRALVADQSITATGCLQRAQRNGSVGGTVVGTSASPDRADDEANSSEMVDAFLLANAVPTDGAGAAPRPQAGRDAPAATGTSGVTPTSFGLEGQTAALEKHTGARVEVTGIVIPAASSGRGTGGAATATGVTRIRVASFKVLAPNCSTP